MATPITGQSINAYPVPDSGLSTSSKKPVQNKVISGALADEYSASKTYAVGDLCIHDGVLYSCTTDITTAEVWTAAHWETGKIGDTVSDLNRQLSDKDLFDDIPGTTQTVTFNANDQPASIVHASGTDTVRTDIFTWADGTVTEVRTLADGRRVTYVTNLTTLVTTISAVEEAT